MKESELKKTVEDYLQIKMNQGILYFDRLNSGDFIEVRGSTRRRVRGCRKGTADFFMFYCDYPDMGRNDFLLIFLELKGDKGRQSEDQKEFQRLVEEQGAEYFIIRSVEQVEDVLR